MATKKPAKSAVPAKLQLPTKFDAFKAELGTNRKAMKICVFGPPDSGKSFMAASAPSPKVVIDTGEGGISYELDPASGDQLLRIADAPVVKVDSTGRVGSFATSL